MMRLLIDCDVKERFVFMPSSIIAFGNVVIVEGACGRGGSVFWSTPGRWVRLDNQQGQGSVEVLLQSGPVMCVGERKEAKGESVCSRGGEMEEREQITMEVMVVEERERERG